ncbi:hypothetical protein ACLOJK_019014 [Asimina triloba]
MIQAAHHVDDDEPILNPARSHATDVRRPTSFASIDCSDVVLLHSNNGSAPPHLYSRSNCRQPAFLILTDVKTSVIKTQHRARIKHAAIATVSMSSLL